MVLTVTKKMLYSKKVFISEVVIIESLQKERIAGRQSGEDLILFKELDVDMEIAKHIVI